MREKYAIVTAPMASPENAAATPPAPPGFARLHCIAAGVVVAGAFLLAHTPPGTGIPEPWKGPFVCGAAREWRTKYGVDPGLRVIETVIVFRANQKGFYIGEGVVLSPVAAGLPGAQDVLEVRGDPPPARQFLAGGVHVLGWEYPGTLHRDLRYTGLALVRRSPASASPLPLAPAFATIGDPWGVDARLDAAELEEHGLQRCKAFATWVNDAAGDPPYTEQILRIIARLSKMRRNDQDRRDDVCEGLRAGSLTIHQAHLLAVMAARQLGAPAVGLTGTDPHHLYLLATYVDGPGWVFANVGSFDGHYEDPAGAFVTLAPLASEYAGAVDGFWLASGAVFRESFAGLRPVSTTRWVTSMSDDEDVTFPESRPLAEVCP